MGNNQSGTNENCFQILYRKIFKTRFMKLITAIKHGNFNTVKMLHKKGINFNQYLDNGDTPLHIAARFKHQDIVKYICENIPNININDRNFLGDTPLLIAVMNGDFSLIKYLVENSADVNARENKGFTPFIAACANGNLEIVKYFADIQEINLKVRTNNGQTALHRAAFYGNFDVIKYLVKEIGMNIYAVDKKGNLPIHYACMKLNVSCARYLFKKAVDPTAVLQFTNKEGMTPLDLLHALFKKLKDPTDNAAYGYKEIEDYLRDKKCAPSKGMMNLLKTIVDNTEPGKLTLLHEETSPHRLTLTPDIIGSRQTFQRSMLEITERSEERDVISDISSSPVASNAERSSYMPEKFSFQQDESVNPLPDEIKFSQDVVRNRDEASSNRRKRNSLFGHNPDRKKSVSSINNSPGVQGRRLSEIAQLRRVSVMKNGAKGLLLPNLIAQTSSPERSSNTLTVSPPKRGVNKDSLGSSKNNESNSATAKPPSTNSAPLIKSLSRGSTMNMDHYRKFASAKNLLEEPVPISLVKKGTYTSIPEDTSPEQSSVKTSPTLSKKGGVRMNILAVSPKLNVLPSTISEEKNEKEDRIIEHEEGSKSVAKSRFFVVRTPSFFRSQTKMGNDNTLFNI